LEGGEPINRLTRECLDLYLSGKQNKEIAEIISKKYAEHFISAQIHDRIKNCAEYQMYNRARRGEIEPPQGKVSFEYKANGDSISERIIEISQAEEITPELMMKKHGLVPHLWEVIAYRNNYWQVQKKGGKRLTLYQSRLTVKPRKQGLSLDAIDEHFKELDRRFEPIKPMNFHPNKIVKRNRMAEVNIADLHFGKMCWHGDTGNNFDYKIAMQVFKDLIERIYIELPRDLDYITFVWANDFFNCDGINNATTAGTPQSVDIRWQKLFNKGVEMLVQAITLFSEIAPIETFYTASNHDELTGYHALKYLEAWFRKDSDIEIDTSPMARKYMLYGNTLLGFTHGDKEKPNRLSSLMPIEAKEMWGKAKFREMHTAHLHSEHMIEEINGVIVRRIASPTATDNWHYTSGYVGAVRKAQTFIYDKEMGLTNIINTPVLDY
jgi:hypothetical protein